jgi:hypothetical protein
MRHFDAMTRWTILVAAFFLALTAHSQQPIADPDFKTLIEHPAYVKAGPTIAIDAAHDNSHTASGQYKPLADLLRSDGYKVVSFEKKLSGEALQGIDVLLIANARGASGAAFTDAECDAVRQWVTNGGALLLIADHAPFGSSVANLAARFDVTMGNGWVFDYPSSDAITTQLTFSHDNGLLGKHSILEGRNPSEKVNVVKSFTGQSLSVPSNAGVLLKLGKNAREAATTNDLDAEAVATAKNDGEDGMHSKSVGGRAQGVALNVGKGRVVILGEAALFTAQIVTLNDGKDPAQTSKAGMNAPGNDDRQFALNVLHWLSRLID